MKEFITLPVMDLAIKAQDYANKAESLEKKTKDRKSIPVQVAKLRARQDEIMLILEDYRDMRHVKFPRYHVIFNTCLDHTKSLLRKGRLRYAKLVSNSKRKGGEGDDSVSPTFMEYLKGAFSSRF